MLRSNYFDGNTQDCVVIIGSERKRIISVTTYHPTKKSSIPIAGSLCSKFDTPYDLITKIFYQNTLLQQMKLIKHVTKM